ncbi:MAG: DUF1552 domain-containing protein, partial [Saccharospirillaceae bacterium]|nr:DUF1552 domain-containing protein [Pseudomonadales bacterium]NRB82062.1 DUF1552 domain-containing protein [Saccharospirillaceae bacterium]
FKALPFAAGLVYSRAAFAATGNTKRVVFVYIPDGAPPGTYTMDGNTFGSTATPLAPHKDNVILFNGCTSNVGGHGKTHLTMGDASNSMDSKLEEVIGATTPFGSMRVGTECNTGQGIMSKKNGADASFSDNPNAVFDRFFGGEPPSTDGALKAQSILDRSRAELLAIRSKLGDLEKKRMDEHESAIQALERRLEIVPVANCTAEDINWSPFGGSTIGDFTEITNRHCDLIASAFRCNLTRVATLQLGTHQAEHVVPESGYGGDYHASIHGAGGSAYVSARKYLTERLAYLIKVLKESNDEYGQPLIDSTIILQVTDMGNGNAHDGNNCPFTIAGGTNILGGRTVSGANNDSLLNTVADALGVADQLPDGLYGSGATASGILA